MLRVESKCNGSLVESKRLKKLYDFLVIRHVTVIGFGEREPVVYCGLARIHPGQCSDARTVYSYSGCRGQTSGRLESHLARHFPQLSRPHEADIAAFMALNTFWNSS